MANVIYFDETRYVEVVESDTADEIVAIGYINMRPEAWTIVFRWKNKPQPDDYTVAPFTPYSTVSIPPGQRKWIPPPGGAGTGPFDSEMAEVVG